MRIATDQSPEVVGRFAPSPTGPLHIGSLVAALGSYLLARQTGGRWLLRMEDIDSPRVVPGCADDILRTLEALGFLWDGPIIWQSQRQQAYQAAFELLVADGRLFPCGCSRAEIAQAATAPHDGEGELVYPGTCRKGLPHGKSARAWRLQVPDQLLCFTDLVQGECRYNLATLSGDFVIRRADGPFAYQLAVVVDDGEQGVNQVVRGADLLSSTPRQLLLQQYLGLPTPVYAHLPLIVDPNGGKLSKRHTVVSLLSGSGMSRTGALLTAAAACLGAQIPSSLAEAPGADIIAWLINNFSPSTIPRGPIASPLTQPVSTGS